MEAKNNIVAEYIVDKYKVDIVNPVDNPNASPNIIFNKINMKTQSNITPIENNKLNAIYGGGTISVHYIIILSTLILLFLYICHQVNTYNQNYQYEKNNICYRHSLDY